MSGSPWAVAWPSATPYTMTRARMVRAGDAWFMGSLPSPPTGSQLRLGLLGLLDLLRVLLAGEILEPGHLGARGAHCHRHVHDLDAEGGDDLAAPDLRDHRDHRRITPSRVLKVVL